MTHRPSTQWFWEDHPVDIQDAASCLDWMDRKAPYIRTSIVAFLGITSGGKSSALCNLLGCNVRRVGPEEIDRGVTLVRAVPSAEFLSYTRHASAADLSHAVVASERCGAWHRPPAYSPKGDPQRYDALYVHSGHTPKPVREAFRKLVDPALLESADCILVNHAALPAGARADHLLRTVFVDTKGFSTQMEGTVKDLEKVVSRSSKTVFFFPCFGENRPLLDALCHITLGAQGVSTDTLQPKADDAGGDLLAKLARRVVSPPVCAAYDAVSDLSSTVTAKERTVGAHDVWKHTLFVTTGLDRFVRSGGRGGGLDGCLNAHYAAGQFMGRAPAALLPTPKPYVVSVPTETEAELQGMGPEDVAYHNRVNQWGELESALFDRLPDEVCDVAARFFEHAVNNRSIAQYAPSSIANTDAWYASKIEEVHNCPHWREHRTQARSS